MKIAVTATSLDLDGPLDPRFGRCPYFLIVDSDTMQFEAVANPFVDASGGAGIQAGQLVASKGAKVVLTGSCGPNAFQTLKSAGLDIVTGSAGTARAAVEAYLSGSSAAAADGPDVPAHFGMGQGRNQNQGEGTGGIMGRGAGRGMGRGLGRGMGQGLGRGMGAGMGRGQGAGRWGAGGAVPDPRTDMDSLVDEARVLRERLEQITAKIAELEKSGRKEQK
jgi:predicted Fe-Mo cluster-binding NifX family protein